MIRETTEVRIIPAALILLSLVGIIESLYFFHKPVSDFGNYFFGALFTLKGNTLADVYDVYSFNQKIAATGIHDFFLDHTSVPPQTILFYIPFAWIGNVLAAKTVFNILGAGALCLSIYRLYRNDTKKDTMKWCAGILLLLFPLHYNIITGQTYLFIGSMLIESYLAFRKSRIILSTALLAVCISLKLFPAVFLLPFLLYKNYRYILYTLTACLLITLLSALVAGVDALQLYYSHLLPRILSGYINDPYSESYQGIQTLLKVLFIRDEALNPHSLIDAPLTILHILYAACAAIIFALLFSLIWRSREISPTVYFACMLPVLFLSGYSAAYSYILPIVFFMGSGNSGSRAGFSYILLLLLCLLPNNLFEGCHPLFRFYKIYPALLLFLLNVPLQFSVKALMFAVSLSAALLFFNLRSEQTTRLHYFRHTSMPADFIFDFKYDNHTFTGLTWNKQGYSDSLTFRFNNSGKELAGKNEIIISRENILIKHPVLFGDSVVFLSDYNRGVGLFNIFIASKSDYNKLTDQNEKQ